MPYRWSDLAPDGERKLTLWPHRSLTRRGFAAFIGATALLFALPLLATLGNAALWFILAPAALVVWAIWAAIVRNSREGARGEVLTLTRDRLTLVHALTTPPLTWGTNPYWVRVRIHPEGGPVPDYLTLAGDGRDVELGAFLSPGERKVLAAELRAALAELQEKPGH
jgi:uncharacterized membrane protein